jgi:hypothetical protein
LIETKTETGGSNVPISVIERATRKYPVRIGPFNGISGTIYDNSASGTYAPIHRRIAQDKSVVDIHAVYNSIERVKISGWINSPKDFVSIAAWSTIIDHAGDRWFRSEQPGGAKNQISLGNAPEVATGVGHVHHAIVSIQEERHGVRAYGTTPERNFDMYVPRCKINSKLIGRCDLNPRRITRALA